MTPRAADAPEPPRTGLARPGVKTVRIGAGGREAEPETATQGDSAPTNLLGAPAAGRPRRPIPLWASRLLAALALLAAIAVIVLLLL